ncbi:uncharacterized protein TRAVEDRAFT_47719 [Trametes versicolor FP-101664 SS1]|uniref:uncharacterized protein n=1 Tax=Trametes versicolor (strain FP-101664) TaxID=717944 RepID=UPI0004623271|nr:uncharacterized protein TRAVEDRAFT_47719 [Trametes versicolor FP-101664 SS1]EIW58578.1 hypothetical protein TRAVEDRAFT_47719 [Trametes versicolor FP-101664 SS1]
MPQKQDKTTHLLTVSTYTPGHDMRTSYPAPYSKPGSSLTSAIPTIVIHPPSPSQQLPQLHPGMNVSEDGCVTRGYDNYSYGVASAKVSDQNADRGRPRPWRQSHGKLNLYCPLVAEKPGLGAASSRASFEARAFAPSESDWRTRTSGGSWHSSTRAGQDGRSVAPPLYFKDELPQPMLTAVGSAMDEEERLIRLLAVILKERSQMYVILCEELRKARFERLRREDQEARSPLGNLVRDLELQ